MFNYNQYVLKIVLNNSATENWGGDNANDDDDDDNDNDDDNE